MYVSTEFYFNITVPVGCLLAGLVPSHRVPMDTFLLCLDCIIRPAANELYFCGHKKKSLVGTRSQAQLS